MTERLLVIKRAWLLDTDFRAQVICSDLGLLHEVGYKKITGKQHFSKSILTSLPYSYQKERILTIRSKLIRNCLRVHGITEKNLHVYLVRKVHFSLPMSSLCSHFSPLQRPVSARGCSPWFTSPDWERCGQTRLLWAIKITGQIRGT